MKKYPIRDCEGAKARPRVPREQEGKLMSMHWLKITSLAGLTALLMAGTVSAQTVRVTVAEYSSKTGPYFEKVAGEFEAANPGTDIQIANYIVQPEDSGVGVMLPTGDANGDGFPDFLTANKKGTFIHIQKR